MKGTIKLLSIVVTLFSIASLALNREITANLSLDHNVGIEVMGRMVKL